MYTYTIKVRREHHCNFWITSWSFTYRLYASLDCNSDIPFTFLCVSLSALVSMLPFTFLERYFYPIQNGDNYIPFSVIYMRVCDVNSLFWSLGYSLPIYIVVLFSIDWCNRAALVSTCMWAWHIFSLLQ
jgi:hypothetical protein